MRFWHPQGRQQSQKSCAFGPPTWQVVVSDTFDIGTVLILSVPAGQVKSQDPNAREAFLKAERHFIAVLVHPYERRPSYSMECLVDSKLVRRNVRCKNEVL